MADYETSGSEIAKLVRKSARSTVYFAFSPAMDAKDSWLALSKRKTASHLHKVARREGPSKKVASGKMRLDGREVCLTCQTEVPALARKFKYFLQENGMSFKVRTLDKNGNLIDTDQEKATIDEDETDAADAAAPQAEEAPEEAGNATDAEAQAATETPDASEELRQDFARLAPLIDRLEQSEDKDAGKAIETLGEAFETYLQDEDYAKASKTLTVLKRKLVAALRTASQPEAAESPAS